MNLLFKTIFAFIISMTLLLSGEAALAKSKKKHHNKVHASKVLKKRHIASVSNHGHKGKLSKSKLKKKHKTKKY